MPYRNEVKPLSLVGDYLAGRRAAVDEEGARQVNALNAVKVQRAQSVNALAQNPDATPEQYIRAGDAQTGAALAGAQQNAQVDKQQALSQLASLAQKALTIQDPAQRRGFLQQAGQTYGSAFAAFGADHGKSMQELQALPDDELVKRLTQVAQFAAAPKPIEVNANASLAVPDNAGGYKSAFTAPAAPTPGLDETARHNRVMEDIGRTNAGGAKPPTGYEPDPASPGQLRFIPGGPADPNVGKGKITDTERLSAAYATRMRKAADKISEINYIPTTADMVKFNYMLGGPGVTQSMANKALSPQAQQYLQSVQDFNRAKLRKESGAAIGKEEVFGDLATFFPVPGDDPNTVEQKRVARETAIEGMIGAAGPAYKAPAANGGWTVKKVK